MNSSNELNKLWLKESGCLEWKGVDSWVKGSGEVILRDSRRKASLSEYICFLYVHILSCICAIFSLPPLSRGFSSSVWFK